MEDDESYDGGKYDEETDDLFMTEEDEDRMRDRFGGALDEEEDDETKIKDDEDDKDDKDDKDDEDDKDDKDDEDDEDDKESKSDAVAIDEDDELVSEGEVESKTELAAPKEEVVAVPQEKKTKSKSRTAKSSATLPSASPAASSTSSTSSTSTTSSTSSASTTSTSSTKIPAIPAMFLSSDPVTAVKGLTEDILIIPERERRTSHAMSTAEYTEAISLRTEQISASGLSGCMLASDELPASASTAREFAIAEMRMRKCPLKLIRNVGSVVCSDGRIRQYVEIWSPNVMTHPSFQ